MPIDRLLIALLVIATVVLTGLAIRWWARRTAARLRGRLGALPDQSNIGTAPVTVLNFTSPHCGTCHRVQKPLLAQVAARYDGRVTVVDVDALARPDLARTYHVLTIPSTVLLVGDRVQEANYGLTSAETLDRQLQAALQVAPTTTATSANLR